MEKSFVKQTFIKHVTSFYKGSTQGKYFSGTRRAGSTGCKNKTIVNVFTECFPLFS